MDVVMVIPGPIGGAPPGPVGDLAGELGVIQGKGGLSDGDVLLTKPGGKKQEKDMDGISYR